MLHLEGVGQVEIDGRSKVTTAVNDRVATEFNLPVAIPKITIDM
jgi:threonine dehydrogenase-like Zn-dependent dehydrogenase